MKIKTLITLYHDGKSHTPQSLVDVANEEAERLIARGFAVKEEAQKPEPEKSKGKEQK